MEIQQIPEIAPAPLRAACAEGRHYACGAKTCSCVCHTKPKRKPNKALASLVVFAVISLMGFILTNTLKPPPLSRLNQNGVAVATSIFISDIEDGLSDARSYTARSGPLELLFWAQIENKVTASRYEVAYDTNEIAADAAYKGKRLMILGTVARIDRDKDGDGAIWLRGSEILGVHAVLTDEGTISAADFVPGNDVALICEGGSRSMSVPTLGGCDTVASYGSRLSPVMQKNVERFLDGKLEMPKDVGRLVMNAYLIGKYLPAGSPCLNGNIESCGPEIMALNNDTTIKKKVDLEAQEMAKIVKLRQTPPSN